MDLTVLNQSFEQVYILETYESLLWVDKFNDVGTFELYSPVTDDILEYFKPNYYLVNEKSEHTMIIEDISIESDIENGNKIKIIGRSLESLLDRRVIWKETTFKENHSLQKAIRKLVERNISSSTNNKPAERRVSNFILAEESSDESITSLKLEEGAQFNASNNLLDVVVSLCSENNIGFKVVLNDQNQFVFSLYNGVNRSYSQSDRAYVVYSPEFDNVLSSNYKEENSVVKNVAFITNGKATDEEGYMERTIGTETGLSRRELYVSYSEVSNKNKQEDDAGTETTITREDMEKFMDQKGKEELAKTVKEVKSFDAQCDTSKLYVYDKDFFMGDIVQLANEYGIESESRVTEFTWSVTTSGIETYPTFVSVEEEVES